MKYICVKATDKIYKRFNILTIDVCIDQKYFLKRKHNLLILALNKFRSIFHNKEMVLSLQTKRFLIRKIAEQENASIYADVWGNIW